VSADEVVTEVTDTEVAAQEVTEEIGPEAAVPGLGNVVATFVVPGSSGSNNRRYRATGLNLTTDRPAVVVFQPRQNDNQDFSFPDQFAVQVNTTARNSILYTVRRLDANAGWGQNLRLDLFIVDRVVNP
jgi:hypothetical protein